MGKLKIPTKRLKLDKNLAYILGVIEGDGWLTKYEVGLNIVDKDFALAFKKALEEWSGMKVSFHIYDNIYWIRLCSKYIANFLKNFDINKIKTSSKECKATFLRGMYDSEGCVSFYEHKSIIRGISLYNQNKHLLQFCKDLLFVLETESNKIVINIKEGYKSPYGISKRNCYELTVWKKENLIKFRDLIGFNIKRKQNKLINSINSYKIK